MIILYVILGIILALGILLFCPVSLYISFEEEISMNCKFLFIKFNIYPQKDGKRKKEKKIKKDENKNSKNNKIRGIIKEKGLSGFLQLIKKLLSMAFGILKVFFKHLHVDSFSLNIMVAEEDSASTAVKYGTVCSIVYPALNIIFKNLYKETYSVIIYPSFIEHKSKVTLKMKAHIKLIYILICAIKTFFKFIKVHIKNFK